MTHLVAKAVWRSIPCSFMFTLTPAGLSLGRAGPRGRFFDATDSIWNVRHQVDDELRGLIWGLE